MINPEYSSLNPLALAGEDEILREPVLGRESPNNANLLSLSTGRGAWYHRPNYYHGKPPMSVTLDAYGNPTDPLVGWAFRFWKYELKNAGFAGGMVLDTFSLGDAFNNSLRRFQATQHGDISDGSLGPNTAKRLLHNVIRTAEENEKIEPYLVYKICSLESGFDLGAEGYIDHLDSGPMQANLFHSGLTILQAVRPRFIFPWAARNLRYYFSILEDRDAMVAAWNCGLGGARWWLQNSKPTEGGPSWFPNLGERATKYVRLVDAQPLPNLL